MKRELDTLAPPAAPVAAKESPEQRLDRLVHARVAQLNAGLSPVSLSLALADWAWHLALSPGRPTTTRDSATPTGPPGPST